MKYIYNRLTKSSAVLIVPSFGGPGGGGNVLKYCSHDYISEFYGKAADAVSRLGVKCGNHFWDAGYVGGSDGSDRSIKCIDGFSAAKVTYGDYVGEISVLCKFRNTYESIGSAKHDRSRDKTGVLLCDEKKVLIRVDISGGSLVDRVRFYCGGIPLYIHINIIVVNVMF